MVNSHSDKCLVSTFIFIVSGLNKIAKMGDEIHQNNVNNTIREFQSTIIEHTGFSLRSAKARSLDIFSGKIQSL